MATLRGAWSGRARGLALWIVAFSVMLAAASYQRLTGPTHPMRGSFELEGTRHEYRLPRSGTSGEPALVRLREGVDVERASLLWRRYPAAQDSFETIEMSVVAGRLQAALPTQPAAGKVEYGLRLHARDGSILELPLQKERPVLRYKNHVPLAVLLPHVLMMFVSMLFGVRAALAALTGGPEARWLVPTTAIGFTVGGMVLGPIVQKFAFGAYWTGWPFGEDLTDNKTLFMWGAWVVAAFVVLRSGTASRSRPAPATRAAILIAAVVMLAVYLVPHSLRGSQLDYDALDAGTRPADAIRTGRSETSP